MIQYQGNKSKIAGLICNRIRQYHKTGTVFYDLCCGSGAISLYWTEPNIMIDSGPWGKFWEHIHYLQLRNIEPIVPTMTHKQYIKFCWTVKDKPVPEDPVEYCYTFLILQRESYQGCAIDIRKKMWVWKGFQKKNWAGTKNIQRVLNRCMGNKILQALQFDINQLVITSPATIYIDPDYEGTRGYEKRSVDLPAFISKHPHCDIFISEHVPIMGCDRSWNVSKETGRLARRSSNQDTEILSLFERQK